MFKLCRNFVFILLTFFLFSSSAFATNFEVVKLELVQRGSNTSVFFNAEFARTLDERMIGLMYRQYLAPDEGMLFDCEEDDMIYMWMKNTPISLDMFFADRNGVIFHIAENTIPLSEDVISSYKPGRYVFEAGAGSAKRLNIRVGDKFIIPGKQKGKQAL